MPPSRELASGRKLPPLLFVTDAGRLTANIGAKEAAAAIKLLTDAGVDVVQTLASDIAGAVNQVRAAIKDTTQGIVIVGGYDVVPSQIVDCLPAALRASLTQPVNDPDDYRVWSDDTYGDRNNDGIADLPVSRIPDARSASLVESALTAGREREPNQRYGLRNSARAAAEAVYAEIPGEAAMNVSGPYQAGQIPAGGISATSAYFWLHGAFWDPGTFWGEAPGTGSLVTAFTRDNLNGGSADVVLAACCWSGLPIDTPAGRLAQGSSFAAVTPEAAISLTFLQAGAIAYVGTTGSHYCPNGAPLHKAFWEQVNRGVPPSKALFVAKASFAAGIPHGDAAFEWQAIEYKTYWEFTCLGIGW